MSTAELRQLRASVEIEVAKREAATLNAWIAKNKQSIPSVVSQEIQMQQQALVSEIRELRTVHAESAIVALRLMLYRSTGVWVEE